MLTPSSSLVRRIQQALELIPPAHRLPPQDDEIFPSLEEGKTRLQNYVFTQGFALASQSFQKGKTVLVLDCTRHGTKTRNYCQLEDEGRVKIGNKVLHDGCKYRLRLKAVEGAWRLIGTNTDHFHDMAMDLFPRGSGQVLPAPEAKDNPEEKRTNFCKC